MHAQLLLQGQRHVHYLCCTRGRAFARPAQASTLALLAMAGATVRVCVRVWRGCIVGPHARGAAQTHPRATHTPACAHAAMAGARGTLPAPTSPTSLDREPTGQMMTGAPGARSRITTPLGAGCRTPCLCCVGGQQGLPFDKCGKNGSRHTSQCPLLLQLASLGLGFARPA